MIRVWILPLSIFLFFNLHASLNEKWNPIWLMKEGVKNGKRRWSVLIKYFIQHLDMINLISILIIHTKSPRFVFCKYIKYRMQHPIIFNWDPYFDKLLFTTCLWACGYKNLDLHEHARILFIFALYVQTHHVMIVSMWAPCLEPISVRRFSQSSNL